MHRQLTSSPIARTRVGPGRAFALLASLVLAATALAQPAASLSRLKRGDPAPALTLRSVDGRIVKSEDLRGTITIMLFGETDHAKTREAYRLINVARDDPGLEDARIEWIVMLSKGSDPGRFDAVRSDRGRPPVVVHDVGREAFGPYGVAVVPSVVVVDGEGCIVHALSLVSPSFADVVTDALLLAAGRIDADQFELTLHPPALAETDHDVQRAERFVRLAERMSRHGMIDAAIAKLEDAVRLDPGSAPAHLGLGALRLQRGEHDEAAVHFAAARAIDPGSVGAALGLATVHLAGDGKAEADALDRGEALVREVLVDHPREARAHYLMGLAHQRRGRVEAAAASFRRAAELLLDGLDLNWSPEPSPAPRGGRSS